MSWRQFQPQPRQQRGAAGLMAALFLILVVSILGQVTLRLASTSVNDSLLTHDGMAALFLAETGLERAAGVLAEGTITCGAGLAGSWTLAGGTVSIANLGAGFNTDFAGAALPAGQCRVRATGSAGLYGAQRTVEAVIGTDAGNLLDPNANFNNLDCIFIICRPTGWSIGYRGFWTWNTGVGGTPAFDIAKGSGGEESITAEHTTHVPFTVTAPTTLTIDFDYSIVAPNNQDVVVQFEMSTGGSFVYSGSRNYTGNSGGFVSDFIPVTVGGSGSVTIDGFQVTLIASAGQPKSLWLDNLVMSGAGGAAGIVRWREFIQ